MNRYMKEAINEAYIGINAGHGGPFGAVIVRDGKIIGRGHNCVIKNNDPTCHGEVTAIRDACKRENNFSLAGCEIYTTAEPCPMCLGAILWAGIDKVYYGCNIYDTENIGFKDSDFYKALKGEDMAFEISETDRAECLKLFGDYKSIDDKKMY
ncbi:MAG: nucleoside deaminase [Firmicutes bacterium]|nr:nucleoside deaminase [Bacillota bacterium]